DEAQLEPVRRPGGDLHVERRRRLEPALAPAGRARGLGPLPPARALRARRDADALGEAARLAPAHLAPAVARRARPPGPTPPARPRPAASAPRGRTHRRSSASRRPRGPRTPRTTP